MGEQEAVAVVVAQEMVVAGLVGDVVQQVEAAVALVVPVVAGLHRQVFKVIPFLPPE